MYLIPSMVIFSIFLFYPFFKTIYLSLYKTNKLGEAKLYVGLDNYFRGVKQANFFEGAKWSLVITVGSVFLILLCTSMCAWYIVRV